MSDPIKSIPTTPTFDDTFIKYAKPMILKPPDSHTKSLNLSPSKNSTSISYNSLHQNSKLDELLKSIAPDRYIILS